MERKIARIILIDTYDQIRAGTRLVVERYSRHLVIGEASNREDGIPLVIKEKPDIVLCGLLNGTLDCTVPRVLTKEMPGIIVLMLLMYINKPLLNELLESNARGFVDLTEQIRDLPRALDAVLAGEPFFEGPRRSGTIGLGVPSTTYEYPANVPTAWEIELVSHRLRGATFSEAAALMGFTERTAQVYWTKLMRKLELDTFEDLARWARQRDLDGWRLPTPDEYSSG